ncbi:hypothetical protein CC86DRAFT_387156 [Ophiobolus disseminans]|uniref:Uncharacterized protein n=1 Tax=Ophiobolus disseminans TaxID=1469910 RepID=A0A6A6ZI32_9PLEO|nr:hypothetical protein CC86DRAFT_387156 [Ophiobolus disseminans]
MDKIGIMLSMLNSVKVLVGKDDTQAYRGARVKRTMVTAVECISADGRCLDPMVERIERGGVNPVRKQHFTYLYSPARTYLAKIALLGDQNTFLAKINNEGKARQSTDSKILGTAKVMRYEDLKKAGAERVVKDAKKAEKQARKAIKEAGNVANAISEAKGASAGKNARGRKRKSAVLEAAAAEPMAKVV